MVLNINKFIVFLLCLQSCFAAWGQGQTVRLVADLLELYQPGFATNALSVEVRKPGVAGEVKMPALFQHPRHPGLTAKVTFRQSLPSVSPGEKIILSSSIAISDGVKLGTLEDGVGFSIQIDGKSIFQAKTRETRWHPFAVDLTEFAGKTVDLLLLTDALQNTAYDWALWGQPRILHFPAPATNVSGKLPIPFSVGTVAAVSKPGEETTFEVAQENGKIFTSWKASESLSVHDLNLPSGENYFLTIKPGNTISALWVNAYAPNLEITQLSPTSAINYSGKAAMIQTQLKNHGPGELKSGDATLLLQFGLAKLPPLDVPRLGPGETWSTQSVIPDLKAGKFELRADVSLGSAKVSRSKPVDIFQESSYLHEAATFGSKRITFLKGTNGFGAARVEARDGTDWFPIATWSPLSRIVVQRDHGPEIIPVDFATIEKDGNGKVVLKSELHDASGAKWNVELAVHENSMGELNLGYTWSSDRNQAILAVLGPNFYVGDESSEMAKSEAVFPGLEYLYKGEQSSNTRDFAPNLADRRSPHPNKVTIPFMGITVGPDASIAPEPLPAFYTPDALKNFDQHGVGKGRLPKHPLTLALLWNPQQEWAEGEVFPTPRFSSPNHDEGMSNHRISLALPSIPKFLRENGELAEKPYQLKADKPLKLEARITIAAKDALGTLANTIKATGGFPKPNPAPRTFQEELDLSRIGFLQTVWDSKTQTSQHCIGWPGSDSPGFAALMWIDSLVATNAEGKKASRERAEFIGNKVASKNTPRALISQAGTHIMQWEFPYLYGHLPSAFEALDGFVANLIKTQHPNGGWIYQPVNAEQSSLGQAGDSVLGTCANRASTILRYARLTGDATAWEAGKKALLFMRNFRVPRGGQTWECPMYEPDILAAAYAIRAYHDAYRITGDTSWLKDSIYWAETGVPFNYLWSLEDKPMMLGASIPVFGSTFYTHSWLAMPVQWCGLVYTFHLFHLQETLRELGDEGSRLISESSMQFQPDDWRRLIELITVSGMHQQFPNGDKIGAYPDSISDFETKNPAFLNPEDLLVNVLALEGHDPDIKSIRIARHGKPAVYVSALAKISLLNKANETAKLTVQFHQGEKVFLLISGAEPKSINIEGTELPELTQKPSQELGWWRDAKGRVFVCFEQKSAATILEWKE